MTRSRSPAVDRRELAEALRGLRERAGLSLEEAAKEALDASAAKLSRIETGKQLAMPRDVRDLCRYYGADEEGTSHLLTLAGSSRKSGWWESYDVDQDSFVGFEAGATEILQLESSLIPGLLQTDGYAETWIGTFNQTRIPRWSESQVREVLALRRDRAARVLDPASGVKVSYVLDEAVFLRQVGGQLIVEQIDWVVELSRRPHIEVRILPFTAGAYPGLYGGFTILTLPGEASDLVYIENYAETLFLDTPEALQRFRGLFASVRRSCLDPVATREKLLKIAQGISRDGAARTNVPGT